MVSSKTVKAAHNISHDILQTKPVTTKY